MNKIDEYQLRPSDADKFGGAVPSFYDDYDEAFEWLKYYQSEERSDELRKAAEEEEKNNFPEGNQATYNWARHQERTWKIYHRTITPWKEVE